MGTVSYTLFEEGMDRLPTPLSSGTRAGAAAELRGRGLNVIAATLEGAASSHVCGVVLPGRETSWVPTLDTDLVDLIKHRYLNR